MENSTFSFTLMLDQTRPHLPRVNARARLVTMTLNLWTKLWKQVRRAPHDFRKGENTDQLEQQVYYYCLLLLFFVSK